MQRYLLAGCAVWALAVPGISARADTTVTTRIQPCDGPVTTVIIVRHADRAGQADSLSTLGLARANDLAEALKTADLRAIYCSDTRRARDTAAPLASALHVTPEDYPAKDCAGLIHRVMREHVGETVLIVGHSNTVPLLVREAGGPEIGDLDEEEYDGLYVVSVTGTPTCGATMVRLQFGAPSPRVSGHK